MDDNTRRIVASLTKAAVDKKDVYYVCSDIRIVRRFLGIRLPDRFASICLARFVSYDEAMDYVTAIKRSLVDNYTKMVFAYTKPLYSRLSMYKGPGIYVPGEWLPLEDFTGWRAPYGCSREYYTDWYDQPVFVDYA